MNGMSSDLSVDDLLRSKSTYIYKVSRHRLVAVLDMTIYIRRPDMHPSFLWHDFAGTHVSELPVSKIMVKCWGGVPTPISTIGSSMPMPYVTLASTSCRRCNRRVHWMGNSIGDGSGVGIADARDAINDRENTNWRDEKEGMYIRMG